MALFLSCSNGHAPLVQQWQPSSRTSANGIHGTLHMGVAMLLSRYSGRAPLAWHWPCSSNAAIATLLMCGDGSPPLIKIITELTLCPQWHQRHHQRGRVSLFYIFQVCYSLLLLCLPTDCACCARHSIGIRGTPLSWCLPHPLGVDDGTLLSYGGGHDPLMLLWLHSFHVAFAPLLSCSEGCAPVAT